MKKILHWCFAMLGLAPAGCYWLLSVLFDRDSSFTAFSQFYSLLPGKLGSFLRVGFYQWVMERCDKEVFIGFGALFSQVDTTLKTGCYIGPQSNIGLCSIGENALIGSGVHIMSGKGQHNFDDLDTPIKDQGGHFEKISIGDDCWIGNGALIMASIGQGSIVAAGSVVINDVADFTVVAGNPARVIKQRK